MKAMSIAAVAVVAAGSLLSPGIPAALHMQNQDVALSTADVNDILLGLEGVTSPPAELPSTPLGEISAGDFYNFYNVVTAGTVTGGTFTVTNDTLAAEDLLNSSLITEANQLAGIGYTNGYIGLSPTDTPGLFSFNDQLGVDFDHGLQALMTAFNQPWISLEDALNGMGATPEFDPSVLNLDPADLGTDASSLTISGDLTAAFTDFSNAFDLAFGLPTD